MSRKRKLNHKNRTFQIESLERREMMSAAPWAADIDMLHGAVAHLATQEISRASVPICTADYSLQTLPEAFRMSATTPKPGTPDTSFGKSGTVIENFSGTDRGRGVATQYVNGQAMTLVVGSINGRGDFGVARFNSSGTLDKSFGENGWAKIHFSGTDEAYGIAVDDQNRIIVVGAANGRNEIGITRLTKGGDLDTSFGTTSERGKVRVNISGGTSQAFDVAIDGNGRIVVVGTSQGRQFAVVRLTDKGMRDTTFGPGGVRTLSWPGSAGAFGVAIDRSNNGIVVVGQANYHEVAVARFSESGTLEFKKSFNDFGPDSAAYDVAIDPTDPQRRIVLVGATDSNKHFLVMRLTSDGSRDNSFDNDGATTVRWSGGAGSHQARGVVIDNGKIIVVGTAKGIIDPWNVVPGSFDVIGGYFGVAQFDDNGKLDASFGDGGKQLVRLAGSGGAFGVVVQNGKIVIAGEANGRNDFAVARLHGNPTNQPASETTLSIANSGPASHQEGTTAAGAAFKFKVTRSGDLSKSTTVNWAVAGHGAHPADAADFVGGKLPSGSLTFRPGQTTKEFTINIASDSNVESDEGFTVRLSNPSSGVKIVTSSVGATIVNDDQATPKPNVPMLAIAPSESVTKSEGAAKSKTTYLFQVTRSGNISGTTTVKYAVTGTGTYKASADDFVGGKFPSGTLTFAANETTKQITVEVAGDGAEESDEQFTITLSSPSGSAVIATSSAIGTIENDDSGGGPGPGDGDVPDSNLGPIFTADVKNGVLTIRAHESGREFVVEQLSKHVRVNAKESAGGAVFKMYDRRLVREIRFEGTAGSDRFVNNTDIDSTAYGGNGDDTLIGGGGNDKLYGEGGNDVIQGRGGDDRIDGGLGNDTLYGGAGNDTLVTKDGTYGNDTIDGGKGKNTVVDDPAPKPKDSVPEVTINKGGLVVINGTNAADNVSVGLSGNEIVVNFNGREKRFAAASVKALEFHGGEGDDKFTNNTSIATTAYGGQGNDTLIGGSGNDVLHGGAGKDWIDGRKGNDDLYGAGGDDTLLGGAGNDRLYGGDGNDHLDGGAGNDRLEGGAGNDGMYGGDGRDFLFGQEGDDWLYGGFGDDELHGGLGNDYIYGEQGNDKLLGGKGNDFLYGNDGDDDLDGQDGYDTLYGDAGNDRLVSRDGTAGNDSLFGGLGVDLLDAPQMEIKQR